MGRNHRITEWPGLKRTVTIIWFQSPSYVWGCQPLHQVAIRKLPMCLTTLVLKVNSFTVSEWKNRGKRSVYCLITFQQFVFNCKQQIVHEFGLDYSCLHLSLWRAYGIVVCHLVRLLPMILKWKAKTKTNQPKTKLTFNQNYCPLETKSLELLALHLMQNTFLCIYVRKNISIVIKVKIVPNY